MALFQPYQRVNRAKVPSYVQAEIAQARADQAAKSAENAARSMNMLGGATIYNQGMNAAGKSPISDFISESFDGGMTGTPTSTEALPNDPSIQQSNNLMDAGLADPSVNPGAMGPVDPALSTVDPLATAAEANAGVVPVDGGIGGMGAEGATAEAIGAEALGAEAIGAEALGADLAGTIGADVGGTAALESALASNAAGGAAGTAAGATGAGTAAGTAAGGAAGSGALSGALAALGPLGAIAALAALFG